MSVKEIMRYMADLPLEDKAEATRDLAQAYLWGEFSAAEARHAEIAMMAIATDNAPLIRKTLAETLAYANNAPLSVIFELAQDNFQIAKPILENSPLLKDEFLCDLIETGTDETQLAISNRVEVSDTVTLKLMDYGSETVALVLLNRHDLKTDLTDSAISRFGDKAIIRELLTQRGGLSAKQKLLITLQNIESLKPLAEAFQTTRSDRYMKESADRAIIMLIHEAETRSLEELCHILQENDKITPSLLLRGLLCGQTAFFITVLSSLMGLEEKRVIGILRDGKATNAVLAKAGMPEALFTPFSLALSAYENPTNEINLTVIETVIAGYHEENSTVLSLLRQFQTEATRDEAKKIFAPSLIPENLEVYGWSEETDITNAIYEAKQAELSQLEEARVAVINNQETPVLDLFKQELETRKTKASNQVVTPSFTNFDEGYSYKEEPYFEYRKAA
jgi:uncharacterized protein (DUF2336 family)